MHYLIRLHRQNMRPDRCVTATDPLLYGDDSKEEIRLLNVCVCSSKNCLHVVYCVRARLCLLSRIRCVRLFMGAHVRFSWGRGAGIARPN